MRRALITDPFEGAALRSSGHQQPPWKATIITHPPRQLARDAYVAAHKEDLAPGQSEDDAYDDVFCYVCTTCVPEADISGIEDQIERDIVVALIAAGAVIAPSALADVYNLEIDQFERTVDGKTLTGVSINGESPGPLLRLREGEDVTINVTNTLDVDILCIPDLSVCGAALGRTSISMRIWEIVLSTWSSTRRVAVSLPGMSCAAKTAVLSHLPD